jgi:hypothetical protein
MPAESKRFRRNRQLHWHGDRCTRELPITRGRVAKRSNRENSPIGRRRRIMGRTLLLASAAMLWVISPAWGNEPAGVGSGQHSGTTGDTGTADDTAGDAPGSAGQQQKMAAEGQPREVEAGLIAKNPAQYYDQNVRVKAEVVGLHGSNAFTLDEDELFAGPDVLVIAPGLETITPKTVVTVSGTVRQLVTAELEEDYAWFRSDSVQPDLLVRFKERPVIIAESIESPTGQQLISSDALQKKSGSSAGDAPSDTFGDDPADDPMDIEKGTLGDDTLQ